MEVRSFDEIGVASWDAFCASTPDAWFRHTSNFMDLALALDETGESKNHSFAIMENDQIVAVVPLIEQPIDETGKREYALGGMTPAPYPAFAAGLSDDKRKNSMLFIMQEVDKRAGEHGVALARMFVDPLTAPLLHGTMSANPLPPHGFEDTSMKTVCIDLSLTEEEILNDMSARRQRYIGAAERKGQYEMHFVDCDSITDAIFDAYRELYFDAAGKTVGTPLRWQVMLEWIRNGYAMLALVKMAESGELIAGHLVMFYKERSYDVNTAIRPSRIKEKASIKDHQVGPYMQWKTMQYMKAHNFTHYEVGWLWPEGISEKVYSRKELTISHFKSLFGGTVLPVFRGRKYYDPEYMEKEKTALAQAYLEREKENPSTF